jgi:hypothetical protein
MTRYKARQDRKAVGQDFPHFVDMPVPPGGLVNQLHAIYEFHSRHSIPPQRGQLRLRANGTFIRWCFADPDAAHDPPSFAARRENGGWVRVSTETARPRHHK